MGLLADDGLSAAEEAVLFHEEHECRLVFSVERRERIYRLHQRGMSATDIAHRIGGLAPWRVRKIIARAEADREADRGLHR